MKNSGCYKCKKCQVHIRVLSKSHHQGLTYSKIINKCPQCNSDIEVIDYSKFDKVKHDLWINATKNKIKYSLKFPVEKKLLKKASPKGKK